MRSLHPSRPLLAGYWRDELPHPKRRRIARHVSTCPVCQRRVNQLEKEAEKAIPIEYDGAFKRAVELARALQQGVDEEARHAKLLLSEILDHPEGGRLDLIVQDPRFHALKLCQQLQDRSRSDWFVDPARSLESARLAAAIADQLDEGRYCRSLVVEARARAWALLGNAYRICCDWHGAEQALERAMELQRLTGDPLVEGDVLCFAASLRNSQDRPEECLHFLDRVLEISREAGDSHQEARALTLKGLAMEDAGRSLDALRFQRKRMSRIDSVADPRLSSAAHHNLLTSLVKLGRFHEAQQLLEKERRLYFDEDGTRSPAKLYWIEGLIDEGLGRLEMAAVHLFKVRESLIERQMWREWALASLHLATVLSKQGRSPEARRMAEESIPIFDSLGLHVRSIAARIVYLRLKGS